MTDRLTKFNEETGRYEFHEVAKTQEEFNAQRKAVIQRLGVFEDKASDVAEEIFAEIDLIFRKQFEKCAENTELKLLEPLCQAERFVINEMWHEVAELKKKYTVTDTNVGCKDTEGGE